MTEQKPTIIVAGELLWDIIDDHRTAAGAPFNFAKHLNHLGMIPTLYSAVGKDCEGDALASEVEHAHVPSRITRSNLVTGYARVISNHGQNAFELANPAAWDELDLTALSPNDTENANAVYFGTLAQRHKTSRSAIRTLVEQFDQKTRILDINLRPPFWTDEVVVWSLEHCSILKMSSEELPAIAGVLETQADSETVARTCFERFNIEIILETQGEKGAAVFERRGQVFACEGCRVPVVSTVGAGDAFLAGFVSHWFDTQDLHAALDFANKYAASVIAGNSAKLQHSKVITQPGAPKI